MNKDSDLTWTITPSDLVHYSIYDQIKNFNERIEQTLDDYLMFKYNISGEQIKKIVNNTNNFKLKHSNFQRVVQEDFESWFDNRELFMTVDRAKLIVHKRWQWEEINNGQI